MKTVKIVFILIFLFSVLLYSQIFTAGGASAMGSAYSSVGSSAEAVCFNPASVAYEKNLELYVSADNKFHIQNYYETLMILRLSRYEFLKLVPSLYYDYENAAGVIGKHTINLTLGNVVFNRVYWGVGLNYSLISAGKAFRTSESVLFQKRKIEMNFGVIVPIIRNIKMSLVLNHFAVFDGGFQYSSDENRQIIIGASYYKSKYSAVSFDCVIDSRDFFYNEGSVGIDRIVPRIGFERYLDFFNTVIRAGLDGLFNPTIGLGIFYKNIEFDYSYLIKLNGSHVFSMKYSF